MSDSNYKRPLKPSKEYRVLCIGDKSDIESCKSNLGDRYSVRAAGSLDEGLNIIAEDSLDGIVAEMTIDDISKIKAVDSTVDIIHIFGERNPSMILEAAMAGASGYLVSPFEPEELLAVVEMIRRNKNVRDKYDTLLIADMDRDESRFIGQCPAFLDIIAKAARLKGHLANVLITGESGTGKEMLARFIHQLEGDQKRPFVAINCAAIPESLIESELFGHEKGAFTGATQRKIGKFELANGGDIFLDEISVLRPEMQAKLLRVLEEKVVCRIGNNAPIKLNFRAIAASNEDLKRLIDKGLFRLDLYHRLKVVEFKMPPLRDRREDIPALVEHFLHKHNKPPHTKIVDEEVLELLKKYSWPGNIRELENLIHNLIIMAPNGSIEVGDIPSYIVSSQEMSADETTLDDYLKSVKREQVRKTLARTNGNKSEAARILGIGRSTLNSLLDEE